MAEIDRVHQKRREAAFADKLCKQPPGEREQQTRAIDQKDRFDLFDQFPDRTIVDVFELHEPGEPFVSGEWARQELSVRSGAVV